jgi:L-alanine-DL-glutamate epimerase-like enolase superfamily enzyme
MRPRVGGLSESRRIAWTAADNNVAFVPHGWNTALGLAADLQLASALPGTELVEYLTGSPYIDDVVAEPWRLDADGMLAIPSSRVSAWPSITIGSPTTRGERLPVAR